MVRRDAGGASVYSCAGDGNASAFPRTTWGVCAGQSQTFSGSWHLNVEKSRWGTAAKPFSVVIVIDHREPAIEYQGSVTYANEESRAFGFAGAVDGKTHKMSRSFGDGEITLRRVDGLTFDSIETSRTSMSRDGAKSWFEVYEKR